MDDFSVKPGVPNMYGAVGGEANAILPGKNAESMTPTIVFPRQTFPRAGNTGWYHHYNISFSDPDGYYRIWHVRFGCVNKQISSPVVPDILYVEKDFPQPVSLQPRIWAIGGKRRLADRGHRISPSGEVSRCRLAGDDAPADIRPERLLY
jgi:hypothetical protein